MRPQPRSIVTFWRALTALLSVLSLMGGTVASASADTSDQLEAAKRKVEETQRIADDITARYNDAYNHYEQINNDIARVEDQIDTGEARAAELHDIVQRRAVEAYMSGGPDITELLVGGDVLDSIRRVELLDRANAKDDDAIAEYGALTEDLRVQRSELQATRGEQQDLLDVLDAEAEGLAEQLQAAQQAQDELEAQLAREEALLREAERLEKERQAQAARAAAAAAAASRAGGGGSSSGAPFPSGPIVCPIAGALSFVDSWGAPRSGGRQHQGVDLMSPFGTPNVAVVSGTVNMHSGGLSGLGVYLSGDDGNTYYYFHLSSYAGGPRRVAQGEVVGYVGASGNASGGAPHTHFEYHPGGGGAVNPYPVVRAVC